MFELTSHIVISLSQTRLRNTLVSVSHTAVTICKHKINVVTNSFPSLVT